MSLTEAQRHHRRPAATPRTASAANASLTGAMGLLALLLVSLLLEVSIVGAVRHARAQAQAYQEFRGQLAAATAPVGQADFEGTLLVVGSPVALLEIPSIGVDEVVLEGTTSSVLSDGVGHRRDTSLPGQVGTSLIFGRRAGYGGPFGDLDDLRAGDEIAVTNGQGEHRYVVTAVRRAGDLLPLLADGEGRLTLVTAAGPPFLPDDALRVDADLISEPVPSPTRILGPEALEPAEEAMAGDEGAALPLFLWAELLLIAALALVALRRAWGRWQSWVVGVPVLTLCALQVDHYLVQLLPNLI